MHVQNTAAGSRVWISAACCCSHPLPLPPPRHVATTGHEAFEEAGAKIECAPAPRRTAPPPRRAMPRHAAPRGNGGPCEKRGAAQNKKPLPRVKTVRPAPRCRPCREGIANVRRIEEYFSAQGEGGEDENPCGAADLCAQVPIAWPAT